MNLYEWLGVAAIVIAGYFALVQLIVSQFKSELRARFKAQDALRQAGQQEQASRFERLEWRMQRFEDGMFGLQKELPIAYVRREDAIRENTIINAKLDALHDKIDKMADRRGFARE